MANCTDFKCSTHSVTVASESCQSSSRVVIGTIEAVTVSCLALWNSQSEELCDPALITGSFRLTAANISVSGGFAPNLLTWALPFDSVEAHQTSVLDMKYSVLFPFCYQPILGKPSTC